MAALFATAECHGRHFNRVMFLADLFLSFRDNGLQCGFKMRLGPMGANCQDLALAVEEDGAGVTDLSRNSVQGFLSPSHLEPDPKSTSKNHERTPLCSAMCQLFCVRGA